MSKKSEYIDKDLIHDLLKPYAHKVVKDLAVESYNVIEHFYRDKVFNDNTTWKPALYQRTYGMKNLFREKMIKTDKGYTIEFTYSADYLTTDHRSNADVFDGSFVNGWHGGKFAWGHLKQETPRTYPSPWMLLTSYVNSYKI